MKKVLRNYNFDFDKNERRIINAFCKQVLKQVGGNSDHFRTERAFTAIMDKLTKSDETVKFTKEEFIHISEQLKSNIRYLNEQVKKVWFFKKWIYKSLISQYTLLYDNHFKD